MNSDIENQLQQQIQHAFESKTPLSIQGSNSKAFYGRPVDGETLETKGHTGIINYQPSELVITARAGTPLSEIESTLAEHKQMLAFEPPHFGEHATLGGCVASGLAGPSRPYAGAVRDSVLGMKVINGKGGILNFGGEVMKNVAGYDLSRLITGSQGTLGLILETSLKILPRPQHEATLVFEYSADQAIEALSQWSGKPLPISASFFHDNRLYLRLSGYPENVQRVASALGGELLNDNQVWSDLKEQRHSFFSNKHSLWRLSVPASCDNSKLPDELLIEWGGTVRWFDSEDAPEAIFSLARELGGHACLFKTRKNDAERFQPLDSRLMRYHRQVKQAMDPELILNPGKMYKDL